MSHSLSLCTAGKQHDGSYRRGEGFSSAMSTPAARKQLKLHPRMSQFLYHVLHYKKNTVFRTYKSWPKKKKIQSIYLRTPSPAARWRKLDLLGVALTGGLGRGLPGTSVTAEPQWPPRHSASFNLSRKQSGSKQSPSLWFQTTSSSNRPGFRVKGETRGSYF